MDSKKIIMTAYEAIADKKGENIKIIDISEVSVIADYFIVTNGTSSSQVKAISDNVAEKLHELGVDVIRTEGYSTASWILMDFGSIIVHVFSKDDRLFYDLERIWSDGRQITIEDLK